MSHRAFALTLLLLGSCGTATTLGLDAAQPDASTAIDAGEADPVTFCNARGMAACQRDFAAGRANEVQFSVCQSSVDMTCPTFTFPMGCFVTPTRASACVAALSDTSRDATPTPSITECQNGALCTP